MTLLISALGGEGGGVLTNWIVSAAESLGYPTQSTSIPGVAQRTGSTTYYVEIMAVAPGEGLGRRPVFALTPGIGDIDLFVASELLEANRAVAAGYVTADRTTVISSNHRQYLISEKIAMGDGRLDGEKLAATVAANSRLCTLLDIDDLARKSGAMTNSVMLGLIAGSGLMPIAADVFERAIVAEGKGVDANLRGFRAGLAALGAKLAPEESKNETPQDIAPADAHQAVMDLPASARAFASEAIRRLSAYQDDSYAQLYLSRLKEVCAAVPETDEGSVIVRETARHLALRMAYDDVIRVAELKIEPGRLAAIRASRKVKTDEPLVLHEFLKPGLAELCALLPPALGRRVLRAAERRGWVDRLSWGMKVQTFSVLGYLQLWTLSRLKRFRRRTMRFADEQEWIAAWLGDIRAAVALSAPLAAEIAACAGLIKGYGETHRRGIASYRTIRSEVIRPALDGVIPVARAVDAVMNARLAALADPGGARLAECVADIRKAA
jgi:indolepyruvate ferredoxin oxidoreductase beta subunit